MGHHYPRWCRNYRRRNLLTITKENDELAAADKVMGGNQKRKTNLKRKCQSHKTTIIDG